MVAERIFSLLPRFVTPDERHQIAEKLWKHLSPGSDTRLVASPDSRPEDVRKALSDYARQHIRDYEFPGNLRRRFAWVADGDVQLTQKLLNYFQHREYEVAAEAIRMRLPSIARALSGVGGGLTATAAEEIRVGKHTLRIVIRSDAEHGVRLEDPRAAAKSEEKREMIGCLVWLVLAGLFFWLTR